MKTFQALQVIAGKLTVIGECRGHHVKAVTVANSITETLTLEQMRESVTVNPNRPNREPKT